MLAVGPEYKEQNDSVVAKVAKRTKRPELAIRYGHLEGEVGVEPPREPPVELRPQKGACCATALPLGRGLSGPAR